MLILVMPARPRGRPLVGHAARAMEHQRHRHDRAQPTDECRSSAASRVGIAWPSPRPPPGIHPRRRDIGGRLTGSVRAPGAWTPSLPPTAQLRFHPGSDRVAASTTARVAARCRVGQAARRRTSPRGCPARPPAHQGLATLHGRDGPRRGRAPAAMASVAAAIGSRRRASDAVLADGEDDRRAGRAPRPARGFRVLDADDVERRDRPALPASRQHELSLRGRAASVASTRTYGRSPVTVATSRSPASGATTAAADHATASASIEGQSRPSSMPAASAAATASPAPVGLTAPAGRSSQACHEPSGVRARTRQHRRSRPRHSTTM